MITSDRIGSAFMPIVTVAAFVFLVTFVYGVISHDEYDDDDTITITFKCSQVLNFPEQYEAFVVEQCRKIRRK